MKCLISKWLNYFCYSIPRNQELGNLSFTIDKYWFKVSILQEDKPGTRMLPLSLKDWIK